MKKSILILALATLCLPFTATAEEPAKKLTTVKSTNNAEENAQCQNERKSIEAEVIRLKQQDAQLEMLINKAASTGLDSDKAARDNLKAIIDPAIHKIDARTDVYNTRCTIAVPKQKND